MWQCPLCDQEFADALDHPTVVDEYISGLPEQVRPILEAVRATIRETAPDSREKLAWQMPTYWQGKNFFHFAGFKNHLGIYPGPEAIEAFADRLGGLVYSKGAIQFPYTEPIDHELIADLVRYQLEKLGINTN